MKIVDEQILTSPSDLNNFVSCKYLIKNDIKFFQNKLKKREETTEQKLWKKFGIEHELKHYQLFKKKFKSNILIKVDQSENKRFKATIEAMKKGYQLIYKAFLIDEKFRGEADFLIRKEFKSSLGDFSYEVYDTKISRNPKPRHVMQITAYSYMLGQIQNYIPKNMYLIDGADETHSFRVNEFISYFNYTKQNFDIFLETEKKNKIYPEKCSFCNNCDWLDECEGIWEKDNYINQVAGIIRSQTEKLKKEKITTVEALSKIKPKNIKSKINFETKEKIVFQASMQEEKKRTNKSKYIVLNTIPGKGLYKLPKANKGDIFYDIEGFPEGKGRSFEYLHGLYFFSGTKMEFKYFWADKFEPKYEKEIFIELIKFYQKHFDKYPDAFIYHYHTYEKRALRELSNLYSSEFPEGLHFVDRLLRQEKFVDLYRVAIQSIRTSEKDMSLKTLEKFYGFKRKSNITTADDSIKLYDQWLATKTKKSKQDIIIYNEDDCISTFQLREFLIKCRSEEITWFSQPAEENKKSIEKKTWEEVELNLIKDLDKKINKENISFVTTLKDIIGFHRREAKPEWWAKFDRLDKSPEELEDDVECIANCVLKSNKPQKDNEKFIFEYSFNEQEYKLKKGSSATDIFENKSYGKIHEIIEQGENNNTVKISVTERTLKKIENMPSMLTLGPGGPVNAGVIEGALNRFIENFINDNQKKYKCIDDLLKNKLPDILNIKKGEILISNNKDLIEESIKVVKNLNSSYLVFQGPPGSGKTFASAKIILELLKNNKKIGVTSNSHKAINNLLLQVEKFALEENFKFEGVKKSSKEDDLLKGKIINDIRKDNEISETCLLFGGTAWMFSNILYDEKIDYLFIDEAGQVSLANTIAMGTSCKNIILIGDQMQLSQPIKGTHSGKAGKSALEYLLEDKDTIPAEQGIFLNKTRRLNQKICEYISDSFYESRLVTHEVTKKREVNLGLKNIANEGIFYLPIDHTGCSQKSDDEANLIKSIYLKILKTNFKDEKEESKLAHKDILVVAPFNIQTINISNKINENEARIGTIDKFQGQEAKVVFVSMASSDSENLPRHKDFFFSRNRLNVAISRAQCVVIIIFNPNLLLTSCSNIQEMKLLNNFCKLLKYEIKNYSE